MNEKTPSPAGYTPTNYKTIRSRLASVIVVPSVVLLVMWAVFSSYTVFDGFYTRAVAESVKSASIPSVQAFVNLQQERQLSLRLLNKSGTDVAGLRAQQLRTDDAVSTMKNAFAELSGKAPKDIVDRINALNGILEQLPVQRAGVETGSASQQAVFDYYNSLLDAGVALFQQQARTVPDAQAGQSGLVAIEVFRSADWMSRSSTLASQALLNGSFTTPNRLEFVQLVGAYHAGLDSAVPFALQKPREHYQSLAEGVQWKKLVELESRLIENAPGSPKVTESEWRAVTEPVHQELINVAVEQASDGADLGLANANSRFTAVIIGSLIALLAVIIGIVLAVRISNRLVNRALVTRLANLRKDSLTLAQERLPSIVNRLRNGEPVDIRTEVPPLDYGNDEIGQVADAFNAAQYTAVAAAVKESQAREGVNRVFLDIAHRNQGLVHRQLKILDKLEREEENPEQLDSLFQLDHLATRARRNAENLIILAGEQPGRQWRKPVRLSDIIRAAVAETEQYVRVRVNPVPEKALVGVAVADTIHLLAELVDNATAFSSPRSEVMVHSSVVPHGIVIEIEDHGLGMTQEERALANAKLSNPPDFDAMAFRGESRLGLFVVARLAAKRGVKVELRDSPYGGTVALVVLPPSIIAGPASSGDISETTQMPMRSFKDQHHAQEGARFLDAVAETGEKADPRPAEHEVNETASGSVSTEPKEKPPLPRRQRQQNLAPQLMHQDFAQPAEQEPVAHDGEQTAERTRDGLSAFQRGTQEARQTDDWKSEGAPSS